MTDATSSAAQDLHLDSTPVEPSTVAGAWAERAKLLSDPEWKAAFDAGDPAKRTEMNRVMSSGTRWGFGETVNLADFSPRVAEQVAAQRAEQVAVLREQAIDDMRLRAAIPDKVAEQVRQGRPVSVTEKRQAQEERDRLLRDADFVKRLRSGDSEANSRWALLQIVRSSPVAT